MVSFSLVIHIKIFVRREQIKKKHKRTGTIKSKMSWIFNKINTNIRVFFPCLRGPSDGGYDYTSLHALVNLSLMMNVNMQQLFTTCHRCIIFSKAQLKRQADYCCIYFFMYYRFWIAACKRQTMKEVMFQFLHDENRIDLAF